jgi:hypothetical protein
VHQVLEACLLAVVAAPVVTLRSHDGLDGVEDIVLVDITKGVSQARKSLLVPAV